MFCYRIHRFYHVRLPCVSVMGRCRSGIIREKPLCRAMPFTSCTITLHGVQNIGCRLWKAIFVIGCSSVLQKSVLSDRLFCWPAMRCPTMCISLSACRRPCWDIPACDTPPVQRPCASLCQLAADRLCLHIHRSDQRGFFAPIQTHSKHR